MITVTELRNLIYCNELIGYYTYNTYSKVKRNDARRKDDLGVTNESFCKSCVKSRRHYLAQPRGTHFYLALLHRVENLTNHSPKIAIILGLSLSNCLTVSHVRAFALRCRCCCRSVFTAFFISQFFGLLTRVCSQSVKHRSPSIQYIHRTLPNIKHAGKKMS